MRARPRGRRLLGLGLQARRLERGRRLGDDEEEELHVLACELRTALPQHHDAAAELALDQDRHHQHGLVDAMAGSRTSSATALRWVAPLTVS